MDGKFRESFLNLVEYRLDLHGPAFHEFYCESLRFKSIDLQCCGAVCGKFPVLLVEMQKLILYNSQWDSQNMENTQCNVIEQSFNWN